MGVTGRVAFWLAATLVALVACDTLFPYAPDGGDADTDTDTDTDADTDEDLGPLCNDECLFSGDDFCADGGRGAMAMWCDFGTDCSDCGPRSLPCEPFCGEAGAPWECGWDECGEFCAICPVGEFCDIAAHECWPCTCWDWECGADYCGNSCGECDVNEVCDEGYCEPCTCDDPSLECGFDDNGCVCGVCAEGYCNNITHLCDPWATELCNDSCYWVGDGWCDDHGQGCEYAGCPFGSDCTDCGPRDETQRLLADVPCPG